MPDEVDDIEEITRDETVEIEDDENEDLMTVEDDIEPDEVQEEHVVHKPMPYIQPKDNVKKQVTKKAKSKPKAKAKPKVELKKLVKKVAKVVKLKKMSKKRLAVANKKVNKIVARVKKKHKDSKDKDHKKRGPKGVQWTKWRIPYQENSTSGELFFLAIRKHGVKLKELKQVCKKTGADPVVMLKALRSGRCRGWMWNVDDAHNRIRITNHHISSKKGKLWWKGE